MFPVVVKTFASKFGTLFDFYIFEQPGTNRKPAQAGSEAFKSITRTYYKGVAGALLVFDITRADTFQNVANWLDEIHENASSKISLVLVGNKADMGDKRAVPFEEAKTFAENNGMSYVETSAKTGMNVGEAFQKITDMIYQKDEDGTIDVTQESSGVRLGTDVKIEQLKGVQQKFALDANARGGGGCGSC